MASGMPVCDTPKNTCVFVEPSKRRIATSISIQFGSSTTTRLSSGPAVSFIILFYISEVRSHEFRTELSLGDWLYPKTAPLTLPLQRCHSNHKALRQHISAHRPHYTF